MRAAQYVRMSTERQDYSIANQLAMIESYARLHDLQIVKTYSDTGKSGIDLTHRPGLQKLLDDVANAATDFTEILVYDVTRWGRFQDIDESAYYEFLCKRAGIQVHYCAETFAYNDGSMMAALLKAMKRAMAGEYLRELSVKVLAGQCRLASCGYKIGGRAGYGLRRLMVSPDGTSKQILADGERKGLANDRVKYTQGPPAEVAVVRQIYSLYLDDGFTAQAIANLLNARRVPRVPNGPWDKFAINTILNHPKYIGSMVFNRTSKKLGTKNKPNPIDEWVVRPNSFDQIISKERFLEVRRRRKPMYERTDAELVENLRAVMEKHGKLTVQTMRATPGVPSPHTYWNRFGSLANAYAAFGYKPAHRHFGGSLLRFKTQHLREQATTDFAKLFRASGKKVGLIPRGLNIRGFGKLGIEPALPVRTRSGKRRWDVRVPWTQRYKRSIIALLSLDHESILEFVFLGAVPKTKCNFRMTNTRMEGCPRGTAEEVVRAVILECKQRGIAR